VPSCNNAVMSSKLLTDVLGKLPSITRSSWSQHSHC
jgi:hypothetical protein